MLRSRAQNRIQIDIKQRDCSVHECNSISIDRVHLYKFMAWCLFKKPYYFTNNIMHFCIDARIKEKKYKEKKKW